VEPLPGIERFARWLLPRWPALLLRVGFALFAGACLANQRVPFECIYVGPAMMLAGTVLKVLERRRAPSSDAAEASETARERSARSLR